MQSDIINYYNTYDEEGRLSRNNSHQVEWITSMTYFEKLLKKDSYILDGCAGTGNYSFKLAELGHNVIAGDIVPHNVEIIRNKQKINPILKDTYIGSITNLSYFESETFDVVLCMGAFYHIDTADRILAIKECLRVLKPNGLLAISYINNTAVSVLSLSDRLENMDDVLTWHNKKTKDGVFLHMSPSEIEQLAKEYNTKIVAHIGTDGINYMISNKINTANKEDFQKWLQFHLKTCEDKNLLGYSLHGLIILEKI